MTAMTLALTREEWLAALPDGASIERNIDRSLEAWRWDARYGSTSRVGWWESPRRWHLLSVELLLVARGEW
jgi:hypothetical protein